MKSATDYRKALDEAKNCSLNPVREAVKDAILHVEKQMETALARPNDFSSNPYFGDKMPAKAYYKGDYKNFIRLLQTELVPLGYVVEESQDGGGMYATYVVRMPEKRDSVVGPRRKIYNDEERDGLRGGCIYAPGTK